MANNTDGDCRQGIVDHERCSIHKGHLRTSILRALMEENRKGLDVIRRLEMVTEGDWKPSPGSVYPALQELEEASLISGHPEGRSIVYSITREGEIAMSALCHDVKKHRQFLDWLIEVVDPDC